MKKLIVLTLLFLALPCLAAKRVLVMTGGGFNVSMFLGMLEGLQEKGWEPDYVITACGSSLASAIANHAPRSADQFEIVQSAEFHALLRSPTIRLSASAMLGQISKIFQANPLEMPEAHRSFLLGIPDQFLAWPISRDFADRPHRVMLAARALFRGEEAGAKRTPDAKLFEETFFTDAPTARQLEGFSSPVAEGSVVALSTAVQTRYSIVEGARASISDPYYIEPFVLDGNTYFTGAIDLYPIELARTLGDEIVMTYSGPFSPLEQKVIQNVFGYDNNRRLRQVQKQPVEHWIDTSDVDALYAKSGMNPSVGPLGVKLGVPASLEAYREKSRAQWRYGKERALEALGSPVFSTAHIRLPRK